MALVFSSFEISVIDIERFEDRRRDRLEVTMPDRARSYGGIECRLPCVA